MTKDAEILNAIERVEERLNELTGEAERITELEGTVKYVTMERDGALRHAAELEKRVKALMRLEYPQLSDETDPGSSRGRAAAVLKRAAEKGVQLRAYTGDISILLDEIAAEIAK